MPVGRKVKYESAHQMQKSIDEYFAECDREEYVLDKDGNIKTYKDQPMYVKKKTPYTIAGLANWLGFTNQKALRRYVNKEDYKDKLPIDQFNEKTYDDYTYRQVVAKAISKIEQFREESLYTREGVTGAKFALAAQDGWKDTSQLDVTVKSGDIISPMKARERLKALGFKLEK